MYVRWLLVLGMLADHVTLLEIEGWIAGLLVMEFQMTIIG